MADARGLWGKLDRLEEVCYKVVMKKNAIPRLLWLGGSLLILALVPSPGQAAQPGIAGEFEAAASQLDEAAREFNQAAGQNSAQQDGKVPYSGMTASPEAKPQTSASPVDPRNQALTGSPETGYAGTWTDPATGDIITSVIAPTPPQNQGNAQSWPIVVEPNVSPDWGSGWSNGYYGGSDYWPQWPNNPGNPGYGTPPPPPPHYQPHPYPYPPQPVAPMPALPGNFQPGYRPLHPGAPRPPMAGNPNHPVWGNPPAGAPWPGQLPMQPGNAPGWGGAPMPPAGNWPPQPPQNSWGGNQPPQGSNWPMRPMPGGNLNPANPWPGQIPPAPAPGMGANPPGFKPLPMAPAGTQWGNSGSRPGAGRPHGMFGGPGSRGGF